MAATRLDRGDDGVGQFASVDDADRWDGHLDHLRVDLLDHPDHPGHPGHPVASRVLRAGHLTGAARIPRDDRGHHSGDRHRAPSRARGPDRVAVGSVGHSPTRAGPEAAESAGRWPRSGDSAQAASASHLTAEPAARDSRRVAVRCDPDVHWRSRVPNWAARGWSVLHHRQALGAGNSMPHHLLAVSIPPRHHPRWESSALNSHPHRLVRCGLDRPGHLRRRELRRLELRRTAQRRQAPRRPGPRRPGPQQRLSQQQVPRQQAPRRQASQRQRPQRSRSVRRLRPPPRPSSPQASSPQASSPQTSSQQTSSPQTSSPQPS